MLWSFFALIMEIEEEMSNKIEDLVKLEWNNEENVEVCKRTLIGKLLASKIVNKGAMRSMLLRGWNLRCDVKIDDLEKNVFVFSFDEEEDCRKVLCERPWMINGALLMIQEWNQALSLDEVEWKFSPFWIQFHGLPFGGLTSKNAVRMGSSVGEVLEVEKPVVNGRIMRNFLRVKVLLDVSIPVIDGFWIEGPDGKKMWIDVKYEKLQVFCYKCGKIDHDFKICSLEKVMKEDQPEKPKYGSWLGTTFLRGKRDGEIVSLSDLLNEEESVKEVEKKLMVSDLDRQKQILECKVHNSDEGGGMSSFSLKEAFNDNVSGDMMNVLMDEVINYHIDVNLKKSQMHMTESDSCDVKMFDEMCENVVSVSGIKEMTVIKPAVGEGSVLSVKYNKSKREGSVVLEEGGYYVEFPDEESGREVVFSGIEESKIIEDMSRISLKRNAKGDLKMEESVCSKRCRAVLMIGEDDGSYDKGVSLKIKKGKKHSKCLKNIVEDLGAGFFVDVPVEKLEREGFLKEDFCFNADGIGEIDTGKVSGWPKTATEGP